MRPRSRWILVVVLLFAGRADAALPEAVGKISPWLKNRLDDHGQAEFLVLMDSSSRPPVHASLDRAGLYAALSRSARADQASILADLKGRGISARSFYLINAVLVKGNADLARSLAQRPDVARVVGNPRIRGVTAEPPPAAVVSPEALNWNISMVGAANVWATYGTQGEGVVVASADTGVDWGHWEMIDQYRGYDPSTGAIDHAYGWHDAFGDFDYPDDDVWHGTHTLGTMVAMNGLGMAPKAKFIACRNMDGGYGTPASYIECMEWTLAPYPLGGDPFVDGRPDLAPHIVNNSWSCPAEEGCDAHTLDEPLARLQQAGIFMVASAMNTGPSCSTVSSPPAISADVLTVGAINDHREVTSFSSHGPVSIDGSGRRKPDLVAPGWLIYSTMPSQTHGSKSGTSMAAPHVSGAAALLWSYRPALRGLVGLTRCILERSASTLVTDPFTQTCGGIPSSTFPNNNMGHGLLDVFAAFGLPGSDTDPAPDVCDCAPGDPSAWGTPAEVAGVSVEPNGAIAWDAQIQDAGPGVRYDVIRGDFGALRSAGGIGGAGCLALDLLSESVQDAELPLPGTGVYYLVRARNGCGNTGWGEARQNTACD